MWMPEGAGWIEVVCGSMFSGKTEELIRRIRRASIARQSVQTFKPAIDDRFHETDIVSHNSVSVPAVVVRSSREIGERVRPETRVVGIDEAQFFDDGLPDVCDRLADEGRRVIVAGLDQDYLGRPFGPMPLLLAIAERITKTLAICVQCGNPSHRTDRVSDSGSVVEVGAGEKYRALCRRCHAEKRTRLELVG